MSLVKADGLLEGIAANMLLQGNAYVQLIADSREVPMELVQLRPERVQVVADDRGWPIGYAVITKPSFAHRSRSISAACRRRGCGPAT